MAAYLYIDESGSFAWPVDPNTGRLDVERIGLEDGKSDPFMVIAVLAIHDKESKGAISQAVSRAIAELRAEHKGFRANPERRLKELKGSFLRGHDAIRRRLFKRMVAKADFGVYFIVLRKRDISRQLLSADYMDRYCMLVMNILAQVPVRRAQRWVTMVVDSQARAAPTTPHKVSYRTKRHRLAQKRLRTLDTSRKQKYSDSVVSTFKQALRHSGTHLAVRWIRSEDDRCLQAVDVLANFYYERMIAEERRRELLDSMSLEQHKRRQKDSRWLRLQRRLIAWHSTCAILKSNIQAVFSPKVLMRRHAYKIKLQTDRAP